MSEVNDSKVEDNNHDEYHDPAKWKQIMETTLNNYIHMEKRLQYRQKFSNFILTYYSMAIIIYTISSKYFQEHLNTYILEYFGLILSIVILVHSLINASANYANRISRVTESINTIRKLKRELTKKEINDSIKEYYAVTEKTELRNDVDFFRTVRSQCKEVGMVWWHAKLYRESENEAHKRLVNYLSEASPKICCFKIIIGYIMDFIIFILPIGVLLYAFGV